MATGQTIVNRALRLLGAVASGEAPKAQESADGLEALNTMLESWQLDKLSVFAHRTEVFSLVPSQASYTIGPAGNFNTVCPVRIETAFSRVGGVDTPVSVFSSSTWAALPSKSLTGATPACLNYERGAPLGILQVFPVPSAVSALHLVTWVPLTAMALGTQVALPPGYERAIVYNLAIELAPEFEKEPSQAVVKVANDALTMVKRANLRAIEATKELSGLFTQSA